MFTEVKISRKEELELKAAALFREKGYAATSMRDLANHLGIEAASLYSHIKSKEEILQKICFRLAEELFKGLDSVVSNGGGAREQLSAALQAHVEIITGNPDQALVFLQEYRHLSEPFRTDFLKMRKEYERKFMLILRQGIRSGEFRKVDEKITVLTLLSAINSTPVWFRKESGISAREVAAMLTDVLIHGLSADKTEIIVNK